MYVYIRINSRVNGTTWKKVLIPSQNLCLHWYIFFVYRQAASSFGLQIPLLHKPSDCKHYKVLSRQEFLLNDGQLVHVLELTVLLTMRRMGEKPRQQEKTSGIRLRLGNFGSAINAYCSSQKTKSVSFSSHHSSPLRNKKFSGEFK